MMLQCGTKGSLEVGDIPYGSVVSYRASWSSRAAASYCWTWATCLRRESARSSFSVAMRFNRSISGSGWGVGLGTYVTMAMFVGAGVGLLGCSVVGDGGVGSWVLSSSSVDSSWITRVEVDGICTGRRLVSVPCWFLAGRRV